MREHKEAILWFIANIDQARSLLGKWLEVGSCCYEWEYKNRARTSIHYSTYISHGLGKRSIQCSHKPV